MKAELKLGRAFKRGWKPPDRSPPWQWAEKHVRVDKTSPFPGKWRSETSPWVKEVMEVFSDNRVSDISIMCSAQSAKTQTIVCLLAWAIAEDPGPCMWVQAAQDEAKTFARTRLMPTLEDCAPVAELFPTDRFEKSTLEINFATMPLIINGANSQSKLQSKPIRWLFLDEVRNYPPGALEMVLKRTRAFWNARRVIISTPSVSDDSVHRAFLAGDQRRYHVLCAGCGQRSPLAWANIKWDTNETTCPSAGNWNFDALAPTIRYECPGCGHAVRDVPDERKRMAAGGVWVKSNPDAPASRASFTWNAILPPWVRWRDLAEEFLRAKEAVKVGAIEPLKTFINESLGEPWEERAEEDVDEMKLSDYSMEDCAPDGQAFLTVDRQKDHMPAVVRSWSEGGASKLVWCGKCLTFEEVDEVRARFSLSPRRVVIDSGYDTAEVYEACVRFGWTAVKDEDRADYLHKLNSGKMVRRIYSPPQRGDPAMGKTAQGKRYCPLFLLATNPTINDMLQRFRAGHGPAWELPKNTPKDYLYQMSSMTKRRRHRSTDGREIWEWVKIGKRPNDFWACERMQIAAAAIAGILRSKASEDED